MPSSSSVLYVQPRLVALETSDTQLTFEQAYDEISRNVRKEVVKARHAAWIARMREEAFIKIYPIPDEQ